MSSKKEENSRSTLGHIDAETRDMLLHSSDSALVIVGGQELCESSPIHGGGLVVDDEEEDPLVHAGYTRRMSATGS